MDNMQSFLALKFTEIIESWDDLIPLHVHIAYSSASANALWTTVMSGYLHTDMLKHLKEMNMAATINPIDPYYDKQSSKVMRDNSQSNILK